MESVKKKSIIHSITATIFASANLAYAWVTAPATAPTFDPTFQSALVTQGLNGNNNWNGAISGGGWTTDVPHTRTGQTNYFNYIVQGNKTLSEYVENYVGPAAMPWGGSEQVLIMKVNKDDPDYTCNVTPQCMSRIQYNWFPDSTVRDVYFNTYVKIQPDLLQTMPDQGANMWRLLSEFVETALPNQPNQIRASLSINRRQVWGQPGYSIGWLGNVSYTNTFAVVQESFNTTVPIPQGKWFLLTVHYKLGQTDGAFEAGIRVCKDGGGFEGDQQVLFSFKNIQTASGQTNIDVANFMKIYAGSNVLANGPIWQYVYSPRIWVVY